MRTPADNQHRNRRYAVPDHILLATDLEDIDYLLPHAVAQAQAAGATLTLVHAILPPEPIPVDASAIPYIDAEAMEAKAKQLLEGVAAKVRRSGITCDVMVCHGSPQRLVAELADTGNADRLILGTHGRRHLKKMLLGSVAQEILNKVQVPVCTIGPYAHTASPHGMPRKILHPVSLRLGYEQSARLALEIAQFYRAEITLLHVLDRDLDREYGPDRVAEWTRSELQRIIPDEALLWTYVNSQVEVGGVVDHILNVAAEMPADLIVLGMDAAGSFWPVRGDSTTYDIIAQAACPVLTLRHGAQVQKSKQEGRVAVTLG